MAEIYYTNKRKQLATLLGEDAFIGHEASHLIDIIDSGELRPSSETKNKNYCDGYNKKDYYSPYIYFSPFNIKYIYYIRPNTFLFRTNILENKPFYMNIGWKGTNDGTDDELIKFNKPIDELNHELNESLYKTINYKYSSSDRPELMVKRRIPLNQAFALVLGDEYNIDDINAEIIDYSRKVKKYKDDKDDKDDPDNEKKYKQYSQALKNSKSRLQESIKIMEFCRNNGIAIIYHVERKH
jgi:hypothetical protein